MLCLKVIEKAERDRGLRYNRDPTKTRKPVTHRVTGFLFGADGETRTLTP